MEYSLDPYLLDQEDLGFEIARRQADVPIARIDQEILLEQLLEDGVPVSQEGPPFERNLLRAKALLKEMNKLLVYVQLNANAASVRKTRAKVKAIAVHLRSRVSCMQPDSWVQAREREQFQKELETCERLMNAPAYVPHVNEEQLTLGFAQLNITPETNRRGREEESNEPSPSFRTVDRTDRTARERDDAQQSQSFQATDRTDRTPREGDYVQDVPHGVSNTASPIAQRPSESEPRDRVSMVTHVSPYKWNITFQGGHKGPTVMQFLERVHELRMTRNVGLEELYFSAADLLQGPALSWYRSIKYSVGSWAELEEKLKATFLPPDYEESLLDEIRARKQKDDEPAILYISTIRGLFARLTVPPSEKEQLRMIRRNLQPTIAQHLVLVQLETYEDLECYCQRITSNTPPAGSRKATRSSREQLIAPLNATRDDRARRPSDQRTRVRTPRDIAPVCWNCRRRGHQFRQCRARRVGVFCFTCGLQEVVNSECPRCHPRDPERQRSLATEAARTTDRRQANPRDQGNWPASSVEGAAARSSVSHPQPRQQQEASRDYRREGAVPKKQQ